ncbi:MAG: HIG1 domain-containing protein [Pseudomonadota bacterium]
MSDILAIGGVIACAGVLVVLALGVGGFGTGKASPAFSQRMMRLRIIGQAVAVVLLILFALVSQSDG